jgi:hypothetical protein
MSELARGLLDDDQGTRAEGLRESCPQCAAAWTSVFDDPVVENLDAAVAEAFGNFAPPARHHRWLAAAAAAVLAIGIGGTSLMWHRDDVVPAAPSPSASLAAVDFESGELSGLVVVDHDNLAGETASGSEAVFENDLEDGDLSGWTSHS